MIAALAILLLSSLTVTALFVLRRKDGAEAPFRCPGYPVVPALFLLASLAAAVAAFNYDPKHALIGLAIIGAGFPVFFLVRRRSGPRLSPGQP